MGHAVMDRRRGAAQLFADSSYNRRPYDRRGAKLPARGLASPFYHFYTAEGDRRIRTDDRRISRRVAVGSDVTPAQRRSIIFNTYVVCTIDGFISRAISTVNHAYSDSKTAVRAAIDRVFQERQKQLALVGAALLLSLFLVYATFIDVIDPLRNGRIVAEEEESFIRTFRPDGSEWYTHVELFDNGGYQYRGSLTGRQDRTPVAI